MVIEVIEHPALMSYSPAAGILIVYEHDVPSMETDRKIMSRMAYNDVTCGAGSKVGS